MKKSSLFPVFVTVGSSLLGACAPMPVVEDRPNPTVDVPNDRARVDAQTDTGVVTDMGVRTDTGVIEDTGVNTDSGVVAMDVPNGMDVPNATDVPNGMDVPNGGDGGTAAQIRAIVAAPAGAVDLPLNNVLVTYLVPAIAGANVSNDPVGFSVQTEGGGPALYVAIDPATLMPQPTVGDRVSMRVTMTRTFNAGASRLITAVSGFTRSAQNVSLAGLVQDLSASNNFVAMLGNYEYQLVRVTGRLNDVGASAGTSFRSYALTTAGYPMGDMNLRFRIPTTLEGTLGIRQGCQVTLGPTPLWRFTAQAQPSAWVAGDVMVSGCPAVMDAGVDAVDVPNPVDVPNRDVPNGIDVPSDIPSPPIDGGCNAVPVINEVQTGQASGASLEFVELYNPGNCAVNLMGWTLRYASLNALTEAATSLSWTGAAGNMIAPGGYFVLGSANFIGDAGVAQGTITQGMADTAGGVGLYNPNAMPSLVNSMAWQNDNGMLNAGHIYRAGAMPGYAPVPPAALAAGVRSTSRIPNGQNTGNPATDFQARTVATPGAPNM